MMKLKINNIYSKVLFLITLYYSKEASFLYYNSTDSPDFVTYFNYFKYYFSEIESSGREQGLFYYLLNSLNLYAYSENFNLTNFYVYVHRSVQETNFYIYLFGLLGSYYLLKHFKFDQSSILITFSLLNLTPFVMASRLILKPEIIGFATLPWIILCFEKFISYKKIYYLYLSIPFIVISASAKGSILAMVGIFLFSFYFFKILKIGYKNILILIMIFVCTFSLILFEDSRANGVNLIDIQSGANQRPEWDFKAPVNIIYKLNPYKLLTSPIKYQHSDSMISITLLDTFGDYFDLYWDNDASGFFNDRKSVFEFKQSDSIEPPNIDLVNKKLTVFVQKVPDLYLRKFISLVLSTIFFILLIFKIYNYKEYRKFLICPFIGIGVLTFHSISGFPVNNFNPGTGDTLKTIYYSFFLSIALMFLCILIIHKSRIKKIMIVPIIFLMIFLLGFPKNNTEEYTRANGVDLMVDLKNKNNYSTFCFINQYTILSNVEGINKSSCNKNQNLEVQSIRKIKNWEIYTNKPRVPIFNSLLGIAALISSLLLIRNSRD